MSTAPARIAATDLRADSLDGIDDDKSAIAQSGCGRDFARKVDVAGRVDEVDCVGLRLRRTGWDALKTRSRTRRARTGVLWLVEDFEMERYGARFHGDTALLLVLAAVHVPNLARQPRRDYVVGREQRVHERRLAMVDVPNGCYHSH